MNIVEDLANFYAENCDDIIECLDLCIDKTVVFLVSDKEITNVLKYEKTKKEQKIFRLNQKSDIWDDISDDNENLNWFKNLKINSGYLDDDANNSICREKIISSAIPQVFKFRNQNSVSKKIHSVDIIKKYNLIELYFNNLTDFNDTFSDDFKSIISKLIDNFSINNEEFEYSDDLFDVKINKGYDVFFVKNDLDISSVRVEYEKYIKNKMFSKKENSFKLTIGTNSKKNFVNNNININYDSLFYKKEITEDLDILTKYTNFSNVFKYIPNKFIVICQKSLFQNKFNISRFSDDDYNSYMKELYELSKVNEIKLLNIKNGSFEYKYVNISSLCMKYFILNNNLEFKEEVLTRYEIIQKILSVFNYKHNGAIYKNYINFFAKNEDKFINSLHDGKGKVSLDMIYNSLRNELYRFAYQNLNFNSISLYNTIENFLISKNVIDDYRLIKLIELKYNLTNNLINMTNLDKKTNELCGIYTFNNNSTLESSLNNDGKQKLNGNDEYFNKLLQKIQVQDKYLVESCVKNQQIQNIEEFSFVLGVLVHHKKSQANSYDKDLVNVIEYNNCNAKQSIDKYILLKDKYLTSSSNVRKLEIALFEYLCTNPTEKIDYIIFNLGVNKSKNFIFYKKII